MAAVVTTTPLLPSGTRAQNTTALLALYAGTDDEKKNLQGIQAAMLLLPQLNVTLDKTALDARIAAI